MPVERTTGGTSLIDVLDRVLDKGIVIDAWVRVSLVGIDLITVEARVVVASIDTYLKYSEAVGSAPPVGKPAALPESAVMAENGLDGSQEVLGFAFDGTGYGPDEAVWGGEVLLANYKGYQRLVHLKYVPLAGGDISVLRPYRMALAHLWAAGLPWDPDLPPVQACPADERRILRHQLETGLGCAPTSSSTSSSPGWRAHQRPAWAACSTRYRRWSVFARRLHTKPRPRSS